MPVGCADSAVDNVLMKLQREGVDFLRLGRASTVDPSLHARMPGGTSFPDTSVRGLAETAARARVVCIIPLPSIDGAF
jgi:hypothetical protein